MCSISTKLGTFLFDQAPLRALESSNNWLYVFSICGNVDPLSVNKRFCSNIAPAPVFQKTLLECHRLGQYETRKVTLSTAHQLQITISYTGGDNGRNAILELTCYDGPFFVDFIISDRVPLQYVIQARGPAGCPIECARNPASGAVCSGASHGTCSIIASGARCVCMDIFSGSSCSSFTSQLSPAFSSFYEHQGFMFYFTCITILFLLPLFRAFINIKSAGPRIFISSAFLFSSFFIFSLSLSPFSYYRVVNQVVSASLCSSLSPLPRITSIEPSVLISEEGGRVVIVGYDFCVGMLCDWSHGLNSRLWRNVPDEAFFLEQPPLIVEAVEVSARRAVCNLQPYALSMNSIVGLTYMPFNMSPAGASPGFLGVSLPASSVLNYLPVVFLSGILPAKNKTHVELSPSASLERLRPIKHLQFPPDCSKVPFVAEPLTLTGLGSELNRLSLSWAFASEMGALWIPLSGWGYQADCTSPSGWECIFQPVTHCSTPPELNSPVGGWMPTTPTPPHRMLNIKNQVSGMVWGDPYFFLHRQGSTANISEGLLGSNFVASLAQLSDGLRLDLKKAIGDGVWNVPWNDDSTDCLTVHIRQGERGTANLNNPLKFLPKWPWHNVIAAIRRAAAMAGVSHIRFGSDSTELMTQATAYNESDVSFHVLSRVDRAEDAADCMRETWIVGCTTGLTSRNLRLALALDLELLPKCRFFMGTMLSSFTRLLAASAVGRGFLHMENDESVSPFFNMD